MIAIICMPLQAIPIVFFTQLYQILDHFYCCTLPQNSGATYRPSKYQTSPIPHDPGCVKWIAKPNPWPLLSSAIEQYIGVEFVTPVLKGCL
jgi:hypothetical protein